MLLRSPTRKTQIMKILYATDGSEGGLTPARFLASLPHGQDVHVHIVTVQDSQQHQDKSSVLATSEAALGAFPGRVTTTTLHGSSRNGIVDCSTSAIVDVLLCTAEAVDVNLIIAGASGHSALTRFFLGSVAESLARYSPRPVLIARPLTSPLCEVIVGVDGSEGGRAATDFVASQLPLPSDCTLRLTSVIAQPLVFVGDPVDSNPPINQALETVNREAGERIRRHAEALADTLRSTKRGHRIEVELVTLGNPAVELMRIADERSAGLIAVGCQGLSGIERFLLGSVSERVLRHAHCSVLIVK